MKISLSLSLLLAGLLCPLPGTFLPVNLSKLTTLLFIAAMFSTFRGADGVSAGSDHRDSGVARLLDSAAARQKLGEAARTFGVGMT
jgi:formate hydrogenlyase subunit 4